MKKQVETFLPLFNGFYQSNYVGMIDAELEYLTEEGELKEDSDYSVDYEGLSKTITNCVNQVLSNLGLDIDVEFQELISPKEYNFYNDSVNVLLSLDHEKLMIRIRENKEELTKIIKDKYTSYDGFYSSHSNNYNEWYSDLENDFENQSHKVGSILNMLCELEGLAEDEVEEELIANNSIGEFIKF